MPCVFYFAEPPISQGEWAVVANFRSVQSQLHTSSKSLIKNELFLYTDCESFVKVQENLEFASWSSWRPSVIVLFSLATVTDLCALTHLWLLLLFLILFESSLQAS